MSDAKEKRKQAARRDNLTRDTSRTVVTFVSTGVVDKIRRVNVQPGRLGGRALGFLKRKIQLFFVFYLRLNMSHRGKTRRTTHCI